LETFFKIRVKENFSNLDICDSSISCNTRTNEYYLNLNYHDNSKRDNEILKNKKVCSIDPGLSCLLNVYSDNEVHFIGKNILNKINKVCEQIDIITSIMYLKKKITDKSKSKMKIKYRYNSNRRRNLKKALGRKIKYLENLKTELHNKSIKFLTSKYGKIIIPHLDSQKMSKKFNSKLARSLYNISYSTFMKKLELKCIEYDIELVSRPEYYTSKTCTRCGNLKNNLKLSERVYECEKCKIKINRDLNASRNIMLRNNIMKSKCVLPPLVAKPLSQGISLVQIKS
jgi:putative transposase